MAENSVNHTTFVINRSYPASLERVYAALSDPAKKKLWFVQGKSLEVESFEMDFRVGGFERSRLRFKAGAPIPEGTAFANDSVYLDIVANQRIVLAYTMTIGGKRISASQATFELVPEGSGTRLIFTEQGAFFEGADGPRMREDGWRQLLERLAEELGK